ncbi:conserved exported hypothetical protein [Flavobacterium sp. 9R]|uniref:cyclophilin-like fold protein n=1 Tax=Flavobacterium sp. 9R TaxID=2653143 RepID=UPI0012F093DB|nr:cyclophilin-like fold protein [Flavobacterium sp. 9R]VXB02035.1 conserved exported hypothetical protein [Flavobacterium sp. 9R]
MRYLITTVLIIFTISISMASCTANDPEPVKNNTTNTEDNIPKNSTMRITIGTSVFTATLIENATTKAFKALLPLTITMSDLNNNEKFYYFSNTLPTNATPGGSIQNGDLMLYGNNCLVLFYEGFNTSYSYTRLGKINNTSGLIAALGTGNVTVKFEME